MKKTFKRIRRFCCGSLNLWAIECSLKQSKRKKKKIKCTERRRAHRVHTRVMRASMNLFMTEHDDCYRQIACKGVFTTHIKSVQTIHTSSQAMLFTFQIKILPIRIKNNERTKQKKKQNKILATCDLVPFYGFSKHMKSFRYSTRFWLNVIWSLWTTIIYANCYVHFDCRIFVFLLLLRQCDFIRRFLLLWRFF